MEYQEFPARAISFNTTRTVGLIYKEDHNIYVPPGLNLMDSASKMPQYSGQPAYACVPTPATRPKSPPEI